MNSSKRELIVISRSRVFLVGLLILVMSAPTAAQQDAPEGVKFEVISVRVLGEREAAERSPDFFGPNIAVRLRLSSSKYGVSFYGWKNSAIPAGYKVQQTDKDLTWLYGTSNKGKRFSSPGIEAVLFGSKGEWITLPAYSAIEWEELDSTALSGEKHAFTAFLRRGSTEHPSEIISNVFVVPAKNTSMAH